MKSASLDYWRSYFQTAESDIFGIIDHAIMVAVSDCPKEFRLRRDRIAERLFSCNLTRCSGCNQVELAVPCREGDDDKRGNTVNGRADDDDNDTEGGGFGGSKGSKVNSCGRDDNEFVGEVNLDDQFKRNYSYGDAEALTDEIEEESLVLGEVFRIKNILLNRRDESDSVLFESLRRLQLMGLTVDTLKATEIGKPVNQLRKHGSKQIRDLAQTLVDGWRALVDEWYNSAKPTGGDEGYTPESVNPSIVDEEDGLPSHPLDEEYGLPSPPLDDAFLFTAPTTGIELSQFFDGMDDDGNPGNGGELKKKGENGRKPSDHQSITKRKQPISNDPNSVADNKNSQPIVKQESVLKQSKPLSTGSGLRRPVKTEQISNNEVKIERKPDKIITPRKPLNVQKDKMKSTDEAAVQMKLEATKRKLQERYQQAENAKRQRTIQVMELHDLPKQHKNPNSRPGNQNRHWSHGRRQHQ